MSKEWKLFFILFSFTIYVTLFIIMPFDKFVAINQLTKFLLIKTGNILTTFRFLKIVDMGATIGAFAMVFSLPIFFAIFYDESRHESKLTYYGFAIFLIEFSILVLYIYNKHPYKAINDNERNIHMFWALMVERECCGFRNVKDLDLLKVHLSVCTYEAENYFQIGCYQLTILFSTFTSLMIIAGSFLAPILYLYGAYRKYFRPHIDKNNRYRCVPENMDLLRPPVGVRAIIPNREGSAYYVK